MFFIFKCEKELCCEVQNKVLIVDLSSNLREKNLMVN